MVLRRIYQMLAVHMVCISPYIHIEVYEAYILDVLHQVKHLETPGVCINESLFGN